MDEQQFLDSYDPRAFPPAAIAVDLVIVAVAERRLKIFLMERRVQPQAGKYALPGSILRSDETLDACAERTARDKVGLTRVDCRQFQAFSAPDRDQRMRVVTIAYLALTTAEVMATVAPRGEGATELGTVDRDDRDALLDTDGDRLALAFDHNDIVSAAVHRLQFDLDRTDDAFRLLPEEFTLFDLQLVHEAVLGRELNKPTFRKKMLGRGCLEPLGRRDARGAQRPAELYRYRRP